MAVGFDASSESATASTGSTSVASFSWSHAGAASGVKGVLVFTFVNANADDATSVTYGGTTVPAVTGGRALDTTTEAGDCKAWFLGASVPQGTQTVVVNRTNNANVMYAVAITVTGTGNTAANGVVLLENNQALAEQNVDDGSPGTNSMRFAGVNSGLATHPAAGANSTELQFFPATAGSRSIAVVRETTAGQGSRPVGFSAGTDDVAAVHLAVKEIPVAQFLGAATLAITAAGVLTGAQSLFTGAATLALTAAGVLTDAVSFNTQRQAAINGLDSAQAEATGWDALRSGIAVTSLVRDSATQATLTIPALATYNITANETLTWTIPASILTGGVAIVATPTVVITAATAAQFAGTATLSITGAGVLTDTASFAAQRQAIINGIDSAQAEATGWDALRSTIPVTAVVRTSSTVVTITLPALATYDITANETLTVTVPGAALTGGAPIVATPTVVITAAGAPSGPPKGSLSLLGVGA